MRKLLLLVFLLVIGLPTSRLYSQDAPPTPEYSFAYGLQGGEVRVAMWMNPDWVQNAIPAKVLFGRADVDLSLPVWSPDGLTLYVTTYDTIEENVAVNLESYAILNNELTPLLPIVSPENLEFAYEFIRVTTISPDGRYAWVARVVGFQTALVDLQEKRIVAESECPADVLTWQENTVIVACNGRLFADPQIFALDLATGERVQVFVPPQNTYPQEAQFLPDGRYLVGAFRGNNPAEIGLLQTDEYAGSYLGTGSQLQLNTTGNILAFVENDRLKKLPLDTLTPTDLGTLTGNYEWDGESLRFWRTQTSPHGDFQVVRVEASRLKRVERIIYSGVPPVNIDFSPEGIYVALEFQPQAGQSYVEIHGEDGLVWVSDFQLPNSFVQLQAPADRPVAWSKDGEWMHVQYTENLSTFPRTLSVNVNTGDTLLSPEPQAKIVGESPDGVWWVYIVVGNPLDNPTNRLIVYNPVTLEQHLLADGVPLYEDPQFPLWRYIVWSE